MKVFQIIFEKDVATVSVGDEQPRVRTSTEVEEEINYWTGPDLQTVTTAAAVHAYEYVKDLKAVREVLTVTNHIDLKDDVSNLQVLAMAREETDD